MHFLLYAIVEKPTEDAVEKMMAPYCYELVFVSSLPSDNLWVAIVDYHT